MKVNRSGITRTVFVFDKFVIKIPNIRYWKWRHLLNGLCANMNENYCWKHNSGKYEQGESYLLCPVVWASWGGWLLVMKRAERVLSHKDAPIDFHPWIMAGFGGDDKYDNYGYYEGRIVKIDYA